MSIMSIISTVSVLDNNPIPIYYVYRAWANPAVYNKACEWIDANFDCDDASFIFDSFSWINGNIYPAAIMFKSPEDYLVFKLKFRELTF